MELKNLSVTEFAAITASDAPAPGGGTPTTLSVPQLEDLLGTIASCTDVAALEEYTFEAGRPDTIDGDKLAVAKRYGVNVLGSEIVGLIPQQALVDCAAYYLQIENFDDKQVLENNL